MADQLGYRVLQLPRELRDLIYAYIVQQDSPINLTDSDIRVSLPYPILSAELLEVVYTHNTFSITFYSISIRKAGIPIRKSLWGLYPYHKRLIHRLEVNATEALLREQDFDALQRESTTKYPDYRQDYNQLLELPRLEHLTINLQKSSRIHFVWTTFSPIIYRLRERKPQPRITLNISFDAVLEQQWNLDSYLEGGDWTTRPMQELPYLPMGFVDMSELIEPPSDEDRAYVAEHCSELTETMGRDFIRGLLDETPANRRVLASAYVVKEPPLLRVLMAEHYETYKGTQSSGP
ncbi:hypothetical protein EK21DRAFT_110853 [Setomelanomma holmii]|uniref:Uncharacterized protein n=1 Tax=Setomelanomma holmii TaxID=210430 RepID=A0A9P4HBD1_9PLEO|nr:hypothetical protein EK21DRAFT_110853 [Setomelanomma holmii]